MGALFTILVIALALLSVVAVMYLILREKVDHDAHLKYVRSPWTDEAIETQQKVDAHFQQGEALADTVEVAEPEATTGAVDTAAAEAEEETQA